MTQPASTEPSDTSRRHHAYLVVGIVLALSTVMAIVVAFRLRQSERHLTEVQREMTEAGAELDVVGCVDAVVEWFDDCEAMSGLCDQSIMRMMGACLSGRDRAAYCADVGDTATTHFGNDECRERELSRHDRKACALSYRAIDAHCQQIRQGDPS